MTLTLLGRGSAGRHLLESLVVFAHEADTVHVEPHTQLRLDVEGPFAQEVPQEDNLVLRTAHLYRDALGVDRGAYIRLYKTLPVAAGLGGASCDAAALLRILQHLWGEHPLEDLAHRLGSDVPVCVLSQPALVRGTGEKVIPLKDFPTFGLVLARPPIALPTADVFAAVAQQEHTAHPQELPYFHDTDTLFSWLAGQSNALEGAAQRLTPLVGDCLQALRKTPGVVLARMSGSGATCFGVCHTQEAAQRAAEHLRRTYPDWWIRGTHV